MAKNAKPHKRTLAIKENGAICLHQDHSAEKAPREDDVPAHPQSQDETVIKACQPQNGSTTFAEELIAMANATISLDILSPEEKETLGFWRDQLRDSAKDLERIFAAHDALQLGAVDWNEPFDTNGVMTLNAALSAAFMISSHAGGNPIKIRLDRERAARASRARSSVSEKNDSFIIAEEKRLSHNYPELSERSIATNISKSLKNRGEEKTMYAVRSRLRKFKKLRRSARVPE
jgi:hypothetical protein